MAKRPKVTQVVNQAGETLVVGDRVKTIPATTWPLCEIDYPRTGKILRIGYKYVSFRSDGGELLLFGVKQHDDGIWRTDRLEKLPE